MEFPDERNNSIMLKNLVQLTYVSSQLTSLLVTLLHNV
jgi:hypothetical protein